MLLLLTACAGAPCPISAPDVPEPAEAETCTPSSGERVVSCPTPAAVSTLPPPDVGISTFGETSEEVDVAYPAAAVAYERWWWRELEVGRADFDFSPIDDLLERAEAAGQDVGVRVMPEGSGEPDVPAWILDAGVGGTHYWGQFSPDYDDPVLLDAATAFVAALGARFDGHPRLAFVDIGMVGEAGEWHVSSGEEHGAALPSEASWKRIIDAHVDAFPNTPLTMLVGDVEDGGDPVRYAVSRGAGWRADCLGDNRQGWNHMDNFYLQRVEEAGLADVWQSAPVVFETCGTFSTWEVVRAAPDCQLDYALGLHASGLNPKSKAQPASFDSAVANFQERAGYRLRLVEVDTPAAVAVGGPLTVATRWVNTGVAPPYRSFRLGWRWDEGDSIVTGTVRGWLPGQTVDEAVLTAPIATGDHTLQLAILGVEGEDSPRVPLGVEGQAADGWTPVARVRVE